jgi:hypothetical protein
MTWIHAVIDVPDATASIAADFWSAVLGWPLGEPWPRHPELRSFEPPGGDAYVHLQVVDGPSRIHAGLAFCVTGNSPELTFRRDLG